MRTRCRSSYGKPRDARLYQVTTFLRDAAPVVNPAETIWSYRKESTRRSSSIGSMTHWNRLGAYLAAQELDSALGHCVTFGVTGTTVCREAAPHQIYDLARLMHLGQILTADGPDGEQEPVGYADTEGLTREVASEDTTRSIGTRTATRGQIRGAYSSSRDSFAPIMTDYVASDFRKVVTMEYYYVYTPDMLESLDPDVVVYEVNERYLMNLARFTLTDIMPVVQN